MMQLDSGNYEVTTQAEFEAAYEEAQADEAWNPTVFVCEGAMTPLAISVDNSDAYSGGEAVSITVTDYAHANLRGSTWATLTHAYADVFDTAHVFINDGNVVLHDNATAEIETGTVVMRDNSRAVAWAGSITLLDTAEVDVRGENVEVIDKRHQGDQ